jgi:hypothetical protein
MGKLPISPKVMAKDSKQQQKASVETQGDALKMAKATQKSGQSKEQTKSNTSGKAGGLKTVNRSKRAASP